MKYEAIEACSGEFLVRKMCKVLGLTVRTAYLPDELKQEFESKEPGKILAGDITYIRTNIGWVYLAIVMDLYNREVVGYSVSRNIDSELVKRAMGNAIARNGSLRGAIFHSDRGTQYSSESFRRMLEANGIRQSMSRAGCPYDNACSESILRQRKKSVFI